METIKALASALKAFSGGVLVISHDQFFIKAVCDEIWVVGDQSIKEFRESFDEYKKVAIVHTKKIVR